MSMFAVGCDNGQWPLLADFKDGGRALTIDGPIVKCQLALKMRSVGDHN